MAEAERQVRLLVGEEGAGRWETVLERLFALTPDPLAYYTAASFDGWTHVEWRGYRRAVPPGDLWSYVAGVATNLSEAARAEQRERRMRRAKRLNESPEQREARLASKRVAYAAESPEQREARLASKRVARERGGASARAANSARMREARATIASRAPSAPRYGDD